MKCVECKSKMWKLYDNAGKILTNLCPKCDKAAIEHLCKS